MRLKFTIAILVLLLPLAGLVLSRNGFPYKRQSPAITDEDLFKKLNIEKSDKVIQAPNFTLKDLDGNQVSLRDFRGKVVLLNFWATWCPPCRLEMPTMEGLHQEFGPQGLVILAVNFREGPKDVQAFLREHQLTFTTLPDEEGKVFEIYQAWSLPTTYLINRSGELVGKVVGYRDWHSEQARVFFRQLLEQKA